jgi:hypothetical protein
MAFLNADSNTIILDAIITKRGREILAEGEGKFEIVKCAFSDDGIDYNLWNPNSQDGSNYYGQAIENMPIQEANPNQEVTLAYKLVTLPANSTYTTYLATVQPSITLDSNNAVIISPSTLPVDLDATAGYKATIMDSTYATLTVKDPVENTKTIATPTGNSEMNVNARSIVGKSFYITRRNTTINRTTTIEIEGNGSGAKTTINLTINATETVGTVASLATNSSTTD